MRALIGRCCTPPKVGDLLLERHFHWGGGHGDHGVVLEGLFRLHATRVAALASPWQFTAAAAAGPRVCVQSGDGLICPQFA